MNPYYMTIGVAVTYGRFNRLIHGAIFHREKEVPTEEVLGIDFNTNDVGAFPCPTQFKEISELLDGYERTSSFSPKHETFKLDELNWSGFCYKLIQSPDVEQPVIMFINDDRLIQEDLWNEISTQEALETINRFGQPKKEEVNAA